MLENHEAKHCLFCDSLLKGRSDKKFCNDYCRGGYNNELRAIANTQLRNVNSVLSKNHRILKRYFNENQKLSRVTQEKLLEAGFLFKYITQLEVTRAGNTCYYCYDLGYLPVGNDQFQIVRKKENEKK